MLDLSLTAEQQGQLAGWHAFAEEVIRPVAAEHDRDESTPMEAPSANERSPDRLGIVKRHGLRCESDDACGPHRSIGHGRLDPAPVDGQDFGGGPRTSRTSPR